MYTDNDLDFIVNEIKKTFNEMIFNLTGKNSPTSIGGEMNCPY